MLLKHALRRINQLANTPLHQLTLGVDVLSQFFEMEVQVGTDKLELVASFCYLRDMLSAACGRVYSSCMRSAMLNASEIWPLTKPNLKHL